jgi:hypothetical protein
MRTENQIKRKLNELIILKKSLETKREGLSQTESDITSEANSLSLQSERLEESISLLEWVLDEPIGKYHA